MQSLSRLFLRRTVLQGSRSVATQALTLQRFGNPEAVLLYTANLEQRQPGPTEVVVRMLAAPVSALDLTTVKGTSAAASKLISLPAVAGNEGVGVVTQVGKSVSSLQVNDHVIPSRLGLGT